MMTGISISGLAFNPRSPSPSLAVLMQIHEPAGGKRLSGLSSKSPVKVA